MAGNLNLWEQACQITHNAEEGLFVEIQLTSISYIGTGFEKNMRPDRKDSL